MDVRSAPMPTATAGPSRPHHEPRFSWVEQPALPPITTFATRGLMKRNNGDSHHPFNPRADRVRFLIFSRQRSASNTLLNELRRHPNVTCHYEVLNIAQMPPEIGRGLNATYFTAVADRPRFMAQVWDFCPAQACGFKLFDKQMGRPLRELLHAAPPRSVRVIALERQNVTAEYASWRRALSSGNWGVTPKRQDAAAFAKRQTTQCVRHPETCFARPEHGGVEGAAKAAVGPTGAGASPPPLVGFQQVHALSATSGSEAGGDAAHGTAPPVSQPRIAGLSTTGERLTVRWRAELSEVRPYAVAQSNRW